MGATPAKNIILLQIYLLFFLLFLEEEGGGVSRLALLFLFLFSNKG